MSARFLLMVRLSQDGGPMGLILALKSRTGLEPDCFLERRWIFPPCPVFPGIEVEEFVIISA